MSTSPAAYVKFNLKKVEGVKYDLEISAETQKIPGSLEYKDQFEGWLSRAPALASDHPYHEELKLIKIRGVREAGDQINVILSYESSANKTTYPGRKEAQGEPVKRYSLRPSDGEEPMLTNSLYEDVPAAQLVALQALISSARSAEDFAEAESVVTHADGIKGIEKLKRGGEAYLSPRLVWTEKFITDNLADVPPSRKQTV